MKRLDVEPSDCLEMKKVTIDNYLDNHYVSRSNWLRAAVLGANDGIISISSIAIGVAAASSSRDPIVLATVAGLVAGALSMAAGEYVSVSSQTDTEKSRFKHKNSNLKAYHLGHNCHGIICLCRLSFWCQYLEKKYNASIRHFILLLRQPVST